MQQMSAELREKVAPFVGGIFGTDLYPSASAVGTLVQLPCEFPLPTKDNSGEQTLPVPLGTSHVERNGVAYSLFKFAHYSSELLSDLSILSHQRRKVPQRCRRTHILDLYARAHFPNAHRPTESKTAFGANQGV